MSPKSRSSFLRQQQEFVADLLREMVNFLHLSSLCQYLAWIYVGQLKMESSVPKLNWEKMQHEKGLVCGMYFQTDHGFTQTRFPNSSHLAYYPGTTMSPQPRRRNESLQYLRSIVIPANILQRVFHRLAGHLHLVRSSTSLLTTALCFLSKYRKHIASSKIQAIFNKLGALIVTCFCIWDTALIDWTMVLFKKHSNILVAYPLKWSWRKYDALRDHLHTKKKKKKRMVWKSVLQVIRSRAEGGRVCVFFLPYSGGTCIG